MYEHRQRGALIPAFVAATVLLLLLAPGAVGAQSPLTHKRLNDTVPFLPELYARRTAEMQRLSATPGAIVFLGNSITEGGDWARLLGSDRVVNQGIGGDVTYGVLRRVDEVIRHRPAKLFLLIGINDVAKDIPPVVIADNVRKILLAIRSASPETALYLQGILPLDPTYPGFPQHYDKAPYAAEVNALLPGVAAAAGATFVDLSPVFSDARGRLDRRFTYDGLHLNASGYGAWVDHLRRAGHLPE